MYFFQQENSFFPLSFTSLFAEHSTAPPVAMEYEDVDIGEDAPVRCTIKGLWLLTHGGKRYAVLLSPMGFPGEPPLVQVQVAAKTGDTEFAERLFAAMEKAVENAVSYRGKVLSLEAGSMYTGQVTGVTVHKLRSVSRDEVILPPKTLELLDRNIVRFVHHRQSLKRAGQATRKGILFILTTNRPAELEKALAARPGRIDQAIEFPLPDETCRKKLVQLYSRGIRLSDEVVETLVSKTAGTSAAFIKELVRRSMLHHLESADEPVVETPDVENALEELRTSGGSLNRMLLGADGHRTGFCAGVPQECADGE